MTRITGVRRELITMLKKLMSMRLVKMNFFNNQHLITFVSTDLGIFNASISMAF